MADEKSSDPTPGSDPASPREPEQVGGADALQPEGSDPAGTPGGDVPGGQLPGDGADDAPLADEPDDDTADDDTAAADRSHDGADRTAARAMTPDVPADEPTDDELRDGDEPTGPELAGVSASRRPVRRDRAQEGAGSGTELAPSKGRATRRRGEAEADATPGRTNPATFVNESVGELRKVVWPTAEQMRTYFVVVLVFVVFMITVVSSLDLLFGWALLQVFR
ncbi:preprotein translocase subunit SecE [Auraticoccus monumenti]|uniref:Protein translocase subunit SecE n=1 Tax=Auraticoccus monumenti TaxID=675864 RepID=A0A1G6WZV1_9ACTN|nr:preprotein translocase subunit SecE [Auraticoccus monumenti]SDD71173.1 protein translocase subunit secE/sec61 gamma [Auraticoccus monumenti]